MGCFFGLIEELSSHGIIENISFPVQKARALSANALRYAESREKLDDLMIESICMAPYEWQIYEGFYLRSPKPKGFDEFAKYFGIDKMHEFQKQIRVATKLHEIERMPENKFKEICEKIHALLELAQDEEEDIKESLNSLTEKLISSYGNTLSKLADLEKAVRENFFPENESVLQSLFEAMAEKKKALTYEKVQYTVKNFPKKASYDVDDCIEAINETLSYAEKYSCSIEKEIYPIINTINNVDFTANEFNEIVKNIHPDQVKMSPFLEEAISIWNLKIVILKKEEEYENKYGDLKFFYSPVVFDIIEEARNGSAICQEWLVRRLCPNKILFSNEKAECPLTSDQQEIVGDVIAFLFDQPGVYPFDRFMRLRLNLWSEEPKDYLVSLEYFKEAEDCPFALFEWALYTIRNGDENLREIALEKIDKAAASGVYAAARFLSNWYGGKEKGNEEQDDEKLMRYVFLSSKGEFFARKGVHEIGNPDEEFRRIFQAILILKSFMECGDAFFSNRGFAMTNLARYIEQTMSDRNPSEIGLAWGTHEEQKNLNRVKTSWAQENDDPYISYGYSSDAQYGIIISSNYFYHGRYNQSKYYYREIKEIPPDESSEYLKGLTSWYWTSEESLFHVCLTAYYATYPYSPDLDDATLTKMAFCGNPYAICRLLDTKKISETHREVWQRAKLQWEQAGRYYAICPNCFNPVSIEDLFCSECGSKLQGGIKNDL